MTVLTPPYTRLQIFAAISAAVRGGLPVPQKVEFQDEASPHRIVSLNFGDPRNASPTGDSDAEAWSHWLGIEGRTTRDNGATWWHEMWGWNWQIRSYQKAPVPAVATPTTDALPESHAIAGRWAVTSHAE